MKSRTIFGLAGTTIALAIACLTFFVLPAGQAHAQSGSRLCGYIMKEANGNFIGYLYEARQNDPEYHQNCYDAAIEMYNAHIDGTYVDQARQGFDGPNPFRVCTDLPGVQGDWHRHCENACEDVGVNFQSSNSPKDMCDKMEAKNKYKVVFDKASNTTTYKQLG